MSESARLYRLLGPAVKQIEHIGSTAIPGMESKPIIDMMASLADMSGSAALIPVLEANGYEYRPDSSLPERIFFANGPRHSRTHHFSLTVEGSRFWDDHLLFRDYLRSNPGTMTAYRAIKQDLAKRFAEDRPSYTRGKEQFVQEILKAARSK